MWLWFVSGSKRRTVCDNSPACCKPGTATAILLIFAASMAAAADRSHPCDRACLKATLDQYLAAVVKHEPTAAPLAIGYRHTENAINIPLDKGVWQSVSALGKVQRRYIDPESSQAAYHGIVDESGKLAVVTARLRVENRSITEAEWYIARDGDPGLPGSKPPNSWNPESLTATPPPERVLPAGTMEASCWRTRAAIDTRKEHA